MLEQSILEEELNDNNFQKFLKDETFVDYFNTFLALSCFSERLYYNKEFAQLEEFIEELADDVGKDNAAETDQLRKLTHVKRTIYNTKNQSRIGYYVMVLDQQQGIAFVKSFRLPIFLKSELYAEYKLTMILSNIQSSLLGSYDEFKEYLTSSANSFPNGRAIDDTFTAWQDLFRRADSRANLFSYTGASFPLRLPDIMLDSVSDTSSSSGGSSAADVDPHRGCCRVTWETKVLHSKQDTEPETGNIEAQFKLDSQERNEESSEGIAGDLVKNDGIITQPVNDDPTLDKVEFSEESKLDAAKNLKPDSEEDEKSIKELQSGVCKEKDGNQTSQEQTTDSTCESSVLSAQLTQSHDVQKEEVEEQLNTSCEEVKPHSPEYCLNGTKQNHHESVLTRECMEQKPPVNQSEIEESAEENPKTDHNSRSLSKMSSEVSISIIVSDESCTKASGEASVTTDNLTTRYEVEEESHGKNVEVNDTENLQSEFKWDAVEEKISLDDRGSDENVHKHSAKEILEENEVTNEEEQDMDEPRRNEDVVNEGLRPQIYLNVEGEYDEAVDPMFDLDAASGFNLKGIRGIMRRRGSVATSIGFDFDQSDLSDEEECLEEDKPYDLSTKEGLDEFKEFLLDTVAEKYLRFWIDVECLRHSDDRDAMTESILQKYVKNGGLYELPRDTVKNLELQETSKLTYNELKDKHCRVLEPILNYWCARFTMHQQRPTNPKTLEYTRLVNDTPKSLNSRENGSTSVTLEPDTCGMSQVRYNKPLLRPQSSRTHVQMNGDISRPLTAKHKLRAKSAHPRLIPATTPVDTNASTVQLQNIICPIRCSYGFKPKRPPMFTNGPDADYMSTVRLYLNPVPTPDGKLTKMLRRLHRTAISPEKPRQVVEQETNPSDDVMDSLIEGLILEKQTGGYFESFLHKIGNKQYLDCLSFWKSLQEYNAMFFADSLNPSTLSKKAMLMYARYVVSSGTQALGVSQEIQRQVFKQVDPPYEELFDAVEDHVLRCLSEPWKQLQDKEKTTYKMVNTEQTLRHIEIQFMARRRQSVVQTHEHDGTDSDIEKEKISIDEANRPIPVPKDGFSFESLIKNRDEVEFFREFLSKKHMAKGIKDLIAWTDMETFRRIPRFMGDKRNQKAKDVKNAWLTKKYFFGLDSPTTREGQDLIMNLNGGRSIKERPTTPVITECQKFVRARIERRWLVLFKQTTEFLDRQKPRVSAPEIVEDVLLKRRLQRSEAAWKILNSRWVSSSRDVVALRTCLLNPQTCAEFMTFVALKGDTFENDVEFWIEVQKFKDLCHAHAQESFIRRKVQAITDCFLNSAITPDLQIDIPIEMAEKLLERLTGRIAVHPYIFREAQMTVFRMLFNHWKEFIGYRSKVPEGQTLQQHLDEKLNAMRAESKAKRDASERRRLARQSAEKRKKERDERERKRMEDLSGLFSIDTASVFYSDAPEDELNSWFYSKHVVEQERQEHIKRLKEQGLEIPPELLVEDKDELKSRRSRYSSVKGLGLLDSKSLRSKKKSFSAIGTGTEESEKEGSKCNAIGTGTEESDKEGSKCNATSLQAKLLQNLQKHHKASSRRGSFAPSFRRNSILSRKSDPTSSKDDNKTQPQEPQDEVTQTDQEIKPTPVEKPKLTVDEIQVMPDKNDESAQNTQQTKLLHTRAQKSKRVFHKPPPDGRKGVPLDAISCISDYSTLSNIDYQQTRKRSSRVKTGDATPLTFKSLKDFTNSPEGAPLAIPLPLVRITSASNKDAASDEDGSQGDTKHPKSRNIFSASPSQPRLSSAKRRSLITKNQQSVTPDVIVN